MKYRDDMRDNEKWRWHAGVYAWRRVRLGISRDERTSPPDPDGRWFNEALVDEAERELRQKTEGKQTARAKERDAELLAEAPAVENQWAQQHGYADFEDYKTRNNLDHVDAACNVARSLIAAAVIKGKEAFAEPADADPKALLKALSVTAKEVDYSPEAMRRARIALGIEPAADPDEAAA